jgi:orotate phosphoribosyltransferase
MKILLVDDVMTAGTAVRQTVPKIKNVADAQIVGLVLSVDRMEKAKDSDISAVQAVERDFGFPVIPIVTVKDIFAEAKVMTDTDGSPLLSAELSASADAYLQKYGA